jgi:hypothetical protein|tara:strand:+ start:651 stop:1097 length:447 start_codon:yes stop_codon:yes gene_type:complete
MKQFKALYEATMWNFIYKKNKGIFYRGVGKSGQGTGVGIIGAGIYLTWSESMADAFAKRQGAGSEVKKYKIKKNVKMVDAGGFANSDQDFIDVKAMMGFEPHQNAGNDPMFAKMLTSMLKEKGYDGVVHDDVATGIVIFDKKNVKEVK